MKRRLVIVIAVFAIAVVAGVGLIQADGGSSDELTPLTAAEVRAAVAGAPPELAAVHAQGNELLGGGGEALRARIAALRGRPVVVNVWGSWCDPCRAEFPIFQRVAVELGDSVAFLGVDTEDSVAAARRFLRQVPVPYPSYRDEKGAIAAGYGLQATPSTIFYDARGRPQLHQGVYRTKADLEADIRRYALRG